MKIEDIKKGKTVYYPKVDKNSRKHKGSLTVQVLKYFILDVDVINKKVTASCNGAAVTSYKAHEFSRWQADKPTEEEVGENRVKRARAKNKIM